MTKQEQADMEALGTTEDQLASRREALKDVTQAANGRARAARSDKGTKRSPKVQELGTLSESQWAQIGVLVEQVTQASVSLWEARQKHERATGEYRDYLDGLRK